MARNSDHSDRDLVWASWALFSMSAEELADPENTEIPWDVRLTALEIGEWLDRQNVLESLAGKTPVAKLADLGLKTGTKPALFTKHIDGKSKKQVWVSCYKYKGFSGKATHRTRERAKNMAASNLLVQLPVECLVGNF